MMCADIVNPNWIRASSSAVRPNMMAFLAGKDRAAYSITEQRLADGRRRDRAVR
jgi:hypothetical protein